MSYSHSKPISVGDAVNNRADWEFEFDTRRPFVQSADAALDVALRSVPLPDGMMSRLKRMVLAMPEGPMEHRLDYLGC